MPAAIKIRINSARGLPVMDRTTDATDAYITLQFADTPQLRTTVCRRTLNPSWKQEFRIEIADDNDLQDHPLLIKCWDKDIMSSDDEIGAVCIDLNPLLPEAVQIQGWYPLYDTLRGIRGEISIGIKMDFIGDVNPFKESGAGVHFCYFSTPPAGHRLASVIGLVEELIVVPDPEYHFLDSFRTARISNERRQLLMYELSGKLRRQIGRKVLEAGGNAVLAFSQRFDLEGEQSGVIVTRGLGTSVKLRLCADGGAGGDFHAAGEPPPPFFASASPTFNFLAGNSPSLSGMPPLEMPHSPTFSPALAPGPPLAGACGGSFGSTLEEPAPLQLLPHRTGRQRTGGISEVVLLTMTQFPPSAHMRIAGVVSARSVKLLASSRDAQGLRDVWWNELREEIRVHARSLSCATVVGYSETAAYQDELVVLSATGTAVTLKLRDDVAAQMHSPKPPPPPCAIGHTPYLRHESPLPMRLELCGFCGRKYVPELLLATVDVPAELPCLGEACIVQARVGRLKKRLTGESHATAVSQALPFLEYDLHRQLQHKLKIHGKNALFGLRLSVSVGETLMIATAEATGVCVASLPLTPPLRIRRNLEVVDEEDKQLVALQRQVEALSLQNQALHQAELNAAVNPSELPSTATAVDPASTPAPAAPARDDSSDSSVEATGAESLESQRAFVVDVDDEMDEDMIATLLDPQLPRGIYLTASQTEVSRRTQCRPPKQLMLSLLRRVRLDTSTIQPKHLNQQLSKVFHELQATLAFKAAAALARAVQERGQWGSDARAASMRVRKMLPATLYMLSTQVAQPADNEVEIFLSAQALQVGAEDPTERASQLGFDFMDVQLTPLSFVPGGVVRSALGPLCLHLIKETWTLREEGGIANFCHLFVAESHALVRAHVCARGGNVALNFRSECKLTHSAHKNHAYCLVVCFCDIGILSS